MKETYNLKEAIDERLKDIKVDRMLEETIKGKCLGKADSKTKLNLSYIKVAIWLVGILCAFSGTVYALSQFEGFNRFIEEDILQQIAPYVQNINKGDGKGEAKMVVEAAITDHYNSLLVFSFINEGKEPWVEGIQAGDWDESWTRGSGHGPPILSEDGRKLTYYVEGSSFTNIFKDKQFRLKGKNLIYISEVEEDINIPLGKLFELHGTVVDTIDYDYPPQSKYLYMRLERMIKKKIGSKGRQVLKKEPKVSLEYVAMIKDSKLEDPMNPDGGLTIYTRNKSNKYWTDSGDPYVIGTISEVTDVRTGKVYKANGSRVDYDVDTLWKGSLGVSQFRELMDPSIIPYLVATKVTYRVQEVIVEDKWEVEFELEDTTNNAPIKLNMDMEKEGVCIKIKQADLSIFGLTLQGIRGGKPDGLANVSIYEQIKVVVNMKDGTQLKLKSDEMMGDGDKFISSYSIRDDKGERRFIEMDKVESLILNGKEIPIE